MHKLPNITTARLILRNLQEEDAHQVLEYSTDPEVSKYLFWSPHKNIQEAKDAINRYRSTENMMQWAITLREDNQLIGIGGFGIVDSTMRKADLGYSFNPKYWNQGYAAETTSSLVKYGFEKMNLVRIQGAIHPNNMASGIVLEKCGLNYEATLKNWMLIDGVPVDTKIYALTNKGFVNRKLSNNIS